jgi:uncharacterized membrane protein
LKAHIAVRGDDTSPSARPYRVHERYYHVLKDNAGNIVVTWWVRRVRMVVYEEKVLGVISHLQNRTSAVLSTGAAKDDIRGIEMCADRPDSYR